jgi:hypothetical protein
VPRNSFLVTTASPSRRRCCAHGTRLFPIESEFATLEEAGAYERWFHIKVQASRDDLHPSILHDHMLADTEAIIRTAG